MTARTKTNAKTKENPVYSYVTERIIAQLEAGTVPWEKGYNTIWPSNATTSKQYRGINIWLLSEYQERGGYTQNIWLTYKQAQQMKGSVRKGEKSPGIVVFYKLIDKRTDAEKAEMKGLNWRTERYQELAKKVYRVLRYTNVFNIEQTEGIDPEKWESLTPANLADHDPIESAETLLNDWKDAPNLQHTGNSAFYNSRKDLISMPGLERHEVPERYYKTRFHESIHATGHESRLNRPLGNGFGSEKYAFEELIAELGASMLCMLTGIYVEENHQNASAYIKGWLEVLKDDPKFIVQASNKAQQATDYIQGITWE